MYRLFTAPGSGGMIAEAALTLAEIPFEIETVSWDDLGWDSKILAPYNPLGQIPTLILPNGEVMTETAAIILHAADVNPACGLAPRVDDDTRPAFLRWLMFLVSAVYPTFTYGDVPPRFVQGDAKAAENLRVGTDAHRNDLYRYLEKQCGKPWFLGDQFSALDIYFWIMRNWRPKQGWFENECPRLNAVGLKALEIPAITAVQQRNFPD